MKILSVLVPCLILIGCAKDSNEEIEQIVIQKTIDITPDRSFSYLETNYQLDINEDGIFDIIFTSTGSDFTSWYRESISVQSTSSNIKIAVIEQPSGNNDTALCSENMTIPENGFWSSNICNMYSNSYGLSPPVTSFESGPWVDQHDKYLAIQYIVNGEPFYAWIKISHGNSTEIIIKEFTYECKL